MDFSNAAPMVTSKGTTEPYLVSETMKRSKNVCILYFSGFNKLEMDVTLTLFKKSDRKEDDIFTGTFADLKIILENGIFLQVIQN